MSECDADCRLCGALGCLRPTRLTYPEFLRELDQAALRCAAVVVFPPNFLNHPEASQFCAEVARHGMRALVRIRPAQLLTSSELLATLEYRLATFEVVVCSPIPMAVLKARSLPNFKTVFVPSQAFDPTLLYDSLPFSWRASLEVMAPLPAVFEDALGPDDLFLWMSSMPRSLPADSDVNRAVVGRLPGAVADLVFSSGDELAHELRLTVVLAVSAGTVAQMLTHLESLISQSLERHFFEIVIACDRISHDVVETIVRWSRERDDMSVQILRLPECWGDPGPRMAEAFNLAALYARGSQILFLNPEFTLGRELLSTCLPNLSDNVATNVLPSAPPLVVLATRGSTVRALLMSVRHYFNIDGFSRSLQSTGFELEFALWKSAKIGIKAEEIEVIPEEGSPELTRVKVKSTLRRILSAQEFYLSTLDADVYRTHFAMMGSNPRLRQIYDSFTRASLIQSVISFSRRLTDRARAQRVQSAMRVAMRKS
jgi:hypothetical protein